MASDCLADSELEPAMEVAEGPSLMESRLMQSAYFLLRLYGAEYIILHTKCDAS